METMVSQGKILTSAPLCKSFAPVANNCREGLCGCGLRECVWRAFVCALAKAVGGMQSSLFHIFQHGVMLLYVPVYYEVKAPEARQRSRPNASAFPELQCLSGIEHRWENCINKSILPGPCRLHRHLLNLL